MKKQKFNAIRDLNNNPTFSKNSISDNQLIEIKGGNDFIVIGDVNGF